MEWLKLLNSEEITDIRKVYKSGVTDSVMEKVLDSVAIQTSFSIRLAYLRGAEDREKMLE